MKIICATDLLGKSESAIDRAGTLADLVGADLVLLHVVPNDGTDGALEERLQNAITRIAERVRPPIWKAQCTPRVAVLPGTPSRLILDTIDQEKARLLVLGPHNRRLLRDFLDGTIAEKAIESRKCPVLIVRDAPRGAYRRVLLALDTSPASVSAVNAATTLVLSADTTAQVVHVHESPYAGVPEENLAILEQQSLTAVRNLLQRERAHLADIHIRAERGDPTNAILQALDQYQPDLLVMGTRGMGRLRRALLGSVANKVLEQAEGDTLIVPEGSFVSPVRDHSASGRWPSQPINSSEVRVDG